MVTFIIILIDLAINKWGPNQWLQGYLHSVFAMLVHLYRNDSSLQRARFAAAYLPSTVRFSDLHR
jgi:hypothetical protein